MKTNTLSALFVIVMAMGFTLNEAFGEELKFFDATEEQVSSACSASGGTPISDDSGSYGCGTDNAWVLCSSDGSCMGQILDPEEEAQSAQRASLAVVDWNKVTKTTFVGVMSTQSKRQANCPNILAKVRVLDQKSRGLIAKLSPASKSTAVKSLIRRSRSAKSMRPAKMAKLKRRARAKMLGRQRHLAALTGQLSRNTKQRKNLWRQCNTKVGSSMKRKTLGSRPGVAAPFIPGGSVMQKQRPTKK
ncbi:MAG: hypothetical protein BMS9Abin11_1332 [Gammaproteobacteria bacterium]|nr:MAG: hypothetical protein BMS9Abin11_1332 [Gammaproteobacteria bacterium]